GLVVVLTDCCSNFVKLPGAAPRDIPVDTAKQISPVFRHLFFLSRGVVDINATAIGDVSWGDNTKGGLFTYTLTGALMTQFSALKKDKNGNLTWKGFSPQLEKHTAKYFKDWSSRMRSIGERIDAKQQKPIAFALTEQTTAGKTPPPKGLQTHAAVNILNATEKPLRYSWRWDDEKETAFRKTIVKPGKNGLHIRKLASRKAKAPLLILKVEGFKKPATLLTRIFTGKRPPLASQAKNYDFQPKARESTKTKAGQEPGPFAGLEGPPTIDEDEDEE